MRMIRVYCKVVKETFLSDSLAMEGSEQLRKMDVGEVMEVYQGPVVESSVNVLRIHGRALKDGTVGWVTISGNQGLTFLVPGGGAFRVCRPCAMSEDLKDLTAAKHVRMLWEGELLEVLDWSRTSLSATGVTRIRARARGDGAVGWVSLTDEGGTVHLEVM